MMKFLFLFLFLWCNLFAQVELGIDLFFSSPEAKLIINKNIALVINHTSVNKDLKPTLDVFKEHEKEYKLKALFSPEHGLTGLAYAGERIEDSIKSLPIYSLHGKTMRPTEQMLKNINAIIYDLQEIGSRPYTYATTLFYIMEEAAKRNILVIVLDRPNPINGLLVDGPMLNEKWRSFLGYVNIPYCHGMTIGELALFFNSEYKINCNLKIIKMKGWTRDKSFKDTGLHWIPTSPNIPESDTPLYYPTTGILGELDLVNIGIGYTMPFKIVGAPWISAKKFAKELNRQKLKGVFFVPFYFRPFYGLYKNENCEGVKIIISDSIAYKPLSVQYLLFGMLKTLYPKEVEKYLFSMNQSKKERFCHVNGNEEMLQILYNERYITWKLINFYKNEKLSFLETRKKYLLY